MVPRQARLRAAYSDWYAGITPDTWHHALWVRERALANLRNGSPQWENPDGRVLSDAHFEFQGGEFGGGASGIERRMIHRSRNNFGFEKRQRELSKEQEKEEKRQRNEDRQNTDQGADAAPEQRSDDSEPEGDRRP